MYDRLRRADVPAGQPAEPILIVLAYVIALAVIHDMLAGIQASWFSELFDTSHRTSGASLGYQFSAAMIGLIGVAFTRETWKARQRRTVAPSNRFSEPARSASLT